jgi:hypothetical protein
MYTGEKKSMRSREAVTTLLRECLNATIEANSSISLRIVPPKTFPATLASIGIIILVIVVEDSLGVFAA